MHSVMVVIEDHEGTPPDFAQFLLDALERYPDLMNDRGWNPATLLSAYGWAERPWATYIRSDGQRVDVQEHPFVPHPVHRQELLTYMAMRGPGRGARNFLSLVSLYYGQWKRLPVLNTHHSDIKTLLETGRDVPGRLALRDVFVQTGRPR